MRLGPAAFEKGALPMVKSSLCSIRCLLVWSVTLALTASPSVVAEPVRTIGWRAGASVIAKTQDAAALRDSLVRLAGRGDARHVVVHFDRTPGRARRVSLAGAGVSLLSYLGDHAYFAALDRRGLDVASVLRDGSIRRVEPILPEWKLDGRLAAGAVPAWAVTRGRDGAAAVAVCVIFHADVALVPDALAIARRHGAIVRSLLHTVNGLVIELPQANVARLVAEDAVQWIEPPLPAFSEVNDSNRVITEAGIVQDAPYGLSGDGVTVLVYDAGTAVEMHPDFGGRLTSHEENDLSNHATHVAGTIGGDGVESTGPAITRNCCSNRSSPSLSSDCSNNPRAVTWQRISAACLSDPAANKSDFGVRLAT